MEIIGYDNIKVQDTGEVEWGGSALSIGDAYWLSTSDGGVTNTKPTNYIQAIGVATTTTKLLLNVEHMFVYEGATKYDQDTGLLVPYIAVGSANEFHNNSDITWDNCNVGNFGYSPKDAWENSSKPEIIIFYDFENVYWHDDVQMSIRDVMFSFHAQATSQYSWLGHPLKDDSNYSETQWLFTSIIWEAEDQSKAALKFILQEPSRPYLL